MTKPEELSASTASVITRQRGLFVSDLHLFSTASPDPLDLVQQYNGVELLVLGGDIFDFRWSRPGPLQQSVAAAKDWLETPTSEVDTQIVYLPGNHDCDPEFIEVLDDLAKSHSNLRWCGHHLQVGSTLCLHGDLLDVGSLDGLADYRRSFHHFRPRSDIASSAYDVAVAARIHKLIPRIRHRFGAVCERLLKQVADLELDSPSLDRIIFGHTHLPLRSVTFNEVRFENPGAAIRHLEFCPVEFEF